MMMMMQSQPIDTSSVQAPMPQVADVLFCSMDRVASQSYFILCTTHAWQVYRLDKFSATRDSITPVQIVVDETIVRESLSAVRMLRLFALSPGSIDATTAPGLGGIFVSERCHEVDYSRAPEQRAHGPDAGAGDGDDLTVFSFSNERILKQLPSTSSTVLDLQVQRTFAAVLCESHEILLVDLRTFRIQQRIAGLSSPAVALGPRWLAYPGVAPGSVDDDSDSDVEELVPEALMGGSRQALTSQTGGGTGASYNALDVAQGVASGLYYLSKTISPYLGTSPGASAPPTASATRSAGSTRESSHPDVPPASSSYPTSASTPVHAHPQGGWVVVRDLHTGRVVANFQCHATALVHLAFDPSGVLLATSSTKGQNVHVYRLLPPIQGRRSSSRGADAAAAGQLLYKLQRGITHANIADIVFSADSKWINVTTAHGTSHLYAIHPEGVTIGLATHATVPDDGDHSALDGSIDGSVTRPGRISGGNRIRDVCAPLRIVESRTLQRVLKLHHTLPVSKSSSRSTGAPGLHSSSARSPPSTLVGSALDASQALLSHLAQSTNLFDAEEDEDVLTGRRRRRRRLRCLFAADGLRMIVAAGDRLALYDLCVHARHTHVDVPNGVVMTKTRLSSCGRFEATVTHLRTIDITNHRWRVESLSAAITSETFGSLCAATSRPNPTLPSSELRVFSQLGLPLWAHPKVTFRAIDVDNPTGRVLEVKRLAPSQNFDTLPDGEGMATVIDDDQHLFVLEMDSYFVPSGSPVFTGHESQPDQRNDDIPPLDLAKSINLAMSSSLRTSAAAAHKIKKVPPELTEDEHGPVLHAVPMNVKKNKVKKHGNKTTALGTSPPLPSSGASSASTSTSSSPTILQFSLQEMYFVAPDGEDTS